MTFLKHSRTLEVLGHAEKEASKKYDMSAIFRDAGDRLDHDRIRHCRLRIITGRNSSQRAFEGGTLVTHAFGPRQDFW
jgi:hypothetical protein